MQHFFKQAIGYIYWIRYKNAPQNGLRRFDFLIFGENVEDYGMAFEGIAIGFLTPYPVEKLFYLFSKQIEKGLLTTVSDGKPQKEVKNSLLERRSFPLKAERSDW